MSVKGNYVRKSCPPLIAELGEEGGLKPWMGMGDSGGGLKLLG